MKKTRLSLFYVASYLLIGGTAFLAAPQLSASLMLSEANYPDVMLRALGMFMIGIGMIVVQIIRHQFEALYSTTLVVRLFFCACLAVFYLGVGDPFFLLLLAIVGVGLLVTGSIYLSEKARGVAA